MVNKHWIFNRICVDNKANRVQPKFGAIKRLKQFRRPLWALQSFSAVQKRGTKL